mgnify:CR=1
DAMGGLIEPKSDEEEQIRFTFDVRDKLEEASSPSEVLSVIAQFGSEGDVGSIHGEDDFFDDDGCYTFQIIVT